MCSRRARLDDGVRWLASPGEPLGGSFDEMPAGGCQWHCDEKGKWRDDQDGYGYRGPGDSGCHEQLYDGEVIEVDAVGEVAPRSTREGHPW